MVNKRNTAVAASMATASSPAAKRELSHAEIEKRAYEIWCGKGQPSGTELENWLEAERQLRAERERAASARVN